ncbi:hypothetical protein B0H65DRAFT_157791 [Neurospora tetraspora]|uniref:Uncharacterized protein n=1 Tax=Neurospora tetraspora TaxID=94610 RepID=A0AAE0MST7_9PEZI|nr:hypothetical protein B0H65DRAFT_157791 [Neurospora tetraspora]
MAFPSPAGDSDPVLGFYDNFLPVLCLPSLTPEELYTADRLYELGLEMKVAAQQAYGISSTLGPVPSYAGLGLEPALRFPPSSWMTPITPIPHLVNPYLLPGSAAKAVCGHYFTVHVTPEPQCSFASFATNVPGGQNGRQTAEVIEQVVNIFRPRRFSVTLFEAKGALATTPGENADDSRRTLATSSTALLWNTACKTSFSTLRPTI